MLKKLTAGVSLLLIIFVSVACSEQKDPASNSGSAQDSQMKQGKETYQQVCAACHENGLAGAPKFGDKEAWSPRIAQGMDKLFQSAINGKGNMPAKGGQPGLSDQDIRAAIDYMVNNSR